ncbi:hypothetical protein ACYA72_23650, partial [Klebsiella pneumoniae]
RHRSVRLVVLVGLAIDQIAQSGLSSLSVIYYSAQLFSMKIGFNLFYEHGKFAETLTADNILCVLETTPGAHLPHSRENHWCWNTDNPEKSDESF